MKRVQLQLPDPVVDWIDAQADGIESRASFIRRSIAGLMKAEQRAEQQAEHLPKASCSDQLRTAGSTGVR